MSFPANLTRANDVKNYFFEVLFNRYFSTAVNPRRDDINCCEKTNLKISKVTTISDFNSELRKVTNVSMPFVRFFPEVSYIRVTSKRFAPNSHHAYTVFRNRSHLNVKYLFEEKERWLPEEDTLEIHPRVEASYANSVTIGASQNPDFSTSSIAGSLSLLQRGIWNT